MVCEDTNHGWDLTICMYLASMVCVSTKHAYFNIIQYRTKITVHRWFVRIQNTGGDPIKKAPSAGALHFYYFPWHCLNFLPDPQGQASLRPILGSRLRIGSCFTGGAVDVDVYISR